VVDEYKPQGIETEKDVIERKHFLWKVGYKL
jgi:adenosine/AMP kinase